MGPIWRRVVHISEECRGLVSDQLRHVNRGIERRALHALDAKEVPPAVPIALLTVIAGNGNDPGQIRRDGLQGDAHGHGLPSRGHLFVRFSSLLAYGAASVERRELSEAVPVDGMATGHLVRGRTGAEQILLTNGAVGHVLARLAVVIIEKEGIDTHSTVMAVLEVLSPTDSAEATVGAVVGLLLGRHPQIADVTVVLSESDATLDALVAVL